MCRKRDDHEKSTYQVGVNVQNKRENRKKKTRMKLFVFFRNETALRGTNHRQHIATNHKP